MSEPLDVPFHLDSRGRVATTSGDDHVRDLVLQVLFTNPGERVNRPTFGCGLKTLVFAPSDEVLTATTEALVKASLQRWLADEITVEEVAVAAYGERLEITVAYRTLPAGERRVETFRAPAGALT